MHCILDSSSRSRSLRSKTAFKHVRKIPSMAIFKQIWGLQKLENQQFVSSPDVGKSMLHERRNCKGKDTHSEANSSLIYRRGWFSTVNNLVINAIGDSRHIHCSQVKEKQDDICGRIQIQLLAVIKLNVCHADMFITYLKITVKDILHLQEIWVYNRKPRLNPRRPRNAKRSKFKKRHPDTA